MDEPARAKLQLIKGKCAGKNGNCQREDLVLDGLCAECSAEDIDQAVMLAQVKFMDLLHRFPEQAVRDDRGLRAREPAKTFAQRMGALRASVRNGDFLMLALQARINATETTLWMAEELNRRVGRSQPEADKVIRRAKQSADERDFVEAIKFAEQAIALLEPFEEVRVNLRKRFADRARASQAQVETTSEMGGDAADNRAETA